MDTGYGITDMTISRDEIEAIARQAGAAAVQETLRVLGVDVSQPFELQQDFAHLRRWRRTVEALPGRAMVTALTVFVTGIAGAIVIAVSNSFGRHP